MTDYTNLSARAMLVSFSVSTWTGHKFDKAATQKVNDAHGATAKAGRYNKHLLAGAPEHAALLHKAEAIRDLHYRETLPWSDENWRLLPTSNYMAYMDRMRKAMREFERLRADFAAVYPTLVSRAEQIHQELGRLWDPEEYPEVETVVGRFQTSIQIKPVPTAGDFRVDLPAEQLEAIRRDITADVEGAARDAMADAWARLHEAVARVRRATGPDGVVRSTLIEHVRSVVDVLGRLNVSQDEGLDAIRRRVERDLAMVEVEDLRDKDGAIRADTQAKAAAIMAAMADFYAPAAGPAREVA